MDDQEEYAGRHSLSTSAEGGPERYRQSEVFALASPPRASRAVIISMVAILALLVFGLIGVAVLVFGVMTPSLPATVSDSAVLPGELRSIDLGAGVALEVVWIPSGRFQMGSDSKMDLAAFGAEATDMTSEIPRHPVQIGRGFWMGRTEVTNAQFRRFRPAHSSGAYRTMPLDGELQPVVNVSWEDAVAFCHWLSTQSGLAVRLPSEAEWEYACRAGSDTAYAQGDSLESMKGFANSMNPSVAAQFKFSWAAFPWEDGEAVTAPAGRFKPNAWGLHDMHGNAWEWCSDWYGVNYYTDSPEKDPAGPSAGTKHVLRGGSWSDSPWFSRSAFRIARVPKSTRVYDGFRIAITPTSGQPFKALSVTHRG